jgi:replicative DNA helicase
VSDLSEQEKETLKALITTDSQKIKFKWDDNFQRRILALILTDSFFLIQARALIVPEYFSNDSHVDVATVLYAYFDTYKTMPDKEFMKHLVSEKIKGRSDAIKLYYKNELENIYESFIPPSEIKPALLDKLLAFAKMQALRIAMDLSQKDLKTNNPEDEST